jgi:hypothetical protein
MRETVVNSWCDACMSDDEIREPAMHIYTVGIQPGETVRPPLKVLELCEIHNKLVADLMMLLEETGQIPDVKAAPVMRKAGQGKPGSTDTLETNPPMDCPIPDCGRELRRNSLTNHIWSQHLGGVQTKKAQPTKCPTCGDRPEQMMMHRSAAHGYGQLQEAIDTWNERN